MEVTNTLDMYPGDGDILVRQRDIKETSEKVSFWRHCERLQEAWQSRIYPLRIMQRRLLRLRRLPLAR